MDDNLEAWRQFERDHLNMQTKMLQSIRAYVAWFFWLTMIGGVIIFFALLNEDPVQVPVYYP